MQQGRNFFGKSFVFFLLTTKGHLTAALCINTLILAKVGLELARSKAAWCA